SDGLGSVGGGGSDGGCSRAILDASAQVLLVGVHEAAIRMVDDHEFPGPEQMMRYHKGAQRVIRDDSAGIADDVRISLFQSQRASRKAGVHTSEDGELALRPRREPAQFMGARVDFIGGEDFVDDAHGKKSLAKRKEAGTA